MRILYNTRRVLSVLGYLSNEPVFAFKYGHEIFSLTFFVILALFEVSTIMYAVIHLSAGDYQNSLYAGNPAAAVFPAIASFITMTYLKDEVRIVIDAFQNIADKCNNDSTDYSTRIINQIVCCIFRWIQTFSSSLQASRSTFWENFIRGLHRSDIKLRCLLAYVCRINMCEFLHSRWTNRFRPPILAIKNKVGMWWIASRFREIIFSQTNSSPFNENTWFGWITLFCLHVIAGSFYLVAAVTAAAFFAAIGVYFTACAQHFQTTSDEMDETLNGKWILINRLKVKKSFIEAVNFHITAKRYTHVPITSHEPLYLMQFMISQHFRLLSWTDECHNILSINRGRPLYIAHIFQFRNCNFIFLWRWNV